jgi:hypothetical protein
MFDPISIAAVVIFAATYAVVAVGKIPVYHIDRAGAALLGGSLMVGIGVLTAEEAYRTVDFDTITLLLGMMIVVAKARALARRRARLLGLFQGGRAADAPHHRDRLALAVVRFSGAGIHSPFRLRVWNL